MKLLGWTLVQFNSILLTRKYLDPEIDMCQRRQSEERDTGKRQPSISHERVLAKKSKETFSLCRACDSFGRTKYTHMKSCVTDDGATSPGLQSGW
jgi:hypothetical protein